MIWLDTVFISIYLRNKGISFLIGYLVYRSGAVYTYYLLTKSVNNWVDNITKYLILYSILYFFKFQSKYIAFLSNSCSYTSCETRPNFSFDRYANYMRHLSQWKIWMSLFGIGIDAALHITVLCSYKTIN